jgi:hypothetical protein
MLVKAGLRHAQKNETASPNTSAPSPSKKTEFVKKLFRFGATDFMATAVPSGIYAWGFDGLDFEQARHIAVATGFDTSVCVSAYLGAIQLVINFAHTRKWRYKRPNADTLVVLASLIAMNYWVGTAIYRQVAAEHTRPVNVQKQSQADLPILPVTLRQSGDRIIAHKM